MYQAYRAWSEHIMAQNQPASTWQAPHGTHLSRGEASHQAASHLAATSRRTHLRGVITVACTLAVAS